MKDKMNEKTLALIDHISELRKRLIIIGFLILAGSLISYKYIQTIVDIIILPAENLEFIYLSPPELFMAYIKIALLMGVVVSLPLTLGQVWIFVKPGLKKKEKKYIIFSLLMGLVFFGVGVVFAYFVIVPLTIKFFVQVQVDQITPLFSFENYIGFVLSLLLSFGLVFELPLLISLLSILGLIKTETLKKYRKVVIIVIFTLSAVLTPPDVLSQVLMGVPMLGLFELGITSAARIEKIKEKKK